MEKRFCRRAKGRVVLCSSCKLIANESLRGNFGEAIYETILNNYSEEEVIKQYLNWVQEV
jgi:hypothetical protein